MPSRLMEPQPEPGSEFKNIGDIAMCRGPHALFKYPTEPEGPRDGTHYIKVPSDIASRLALRCEWRAKDRRTGRYIQHDQSDVCWWVWDENKS